MKALGVISTAVVFLFLGTAVPAFAQEEHHEQEAKPEKQQEAKPAKQEQAKPAKQEEHAQPAKQQEQAKPAKQEEHAQAQQNQGKNDEHQRQQENGHAQYARSGQKDSHGHVYNESHFGPEHHARFEANGGRFSNGRREYSYGGYWFYAGVYPAWFYQQDVYFVMGADGLWYAVATGNPSLTFEVSIQ